MSKRERKPGCSYWINDSQVTILLEALDMLANDWRTTREQGHPELLEMEKIEDKFLKGIGR